jgi:hypothetical protein
MQTVYVHISNEDGVMAEIDELPEPGDQFIKVINPRKRDGKDLHYLQPDVTTMIIPWWRITFVEVMPTGEEEDVFTFIRD